MKNFVRLALISAIAAAATGCGNKGPLVLPEKPAPVETAPAAPAEPVPPESTPPADATAPASPETAPEPATDASGSDGNG